MEVVVVVRQKIKGGGEVIAAIVTIAITAVVTVVLVEMIVKVVTVLRYNKKRGKSCS